jgi:hypothetical protein
MPKYKIEGKIYNAATEEEAYAQAYPQNGASKVSAAPRNRTLGEQVQTLPQDLARQLALTGRNVATGLTAIPGMAADATMAGYNLLTGSNQQMPTQALQEAMTRAGVPEPQTGLERNLGMVQSAMAGSRVPLPQFGTQAPANFQRAPTNVEREFATTRDAGYVVPPSTIKPTMGNVAVESLGGKIATAQTASLRNQEVTNRLASQSVGLSPNQPLTPAALKNLRETAGQAYQRLGNVGRITPDLDFYADISRIRSGIAQIQRDFPKADIGAGDKIDDLVKSLQRPGFDSKSGLEYIKELRKSAVGNLTGQNAADPANRSLGTAQQKAADALEDMIERQLSQTGNQSLVDEFRAARQLIAKTYTVQNALETTGNVNASKLAALLRKDKPLSPELTTAARFAGAFPKAAAMPERVAGPGVSALDAGVAGAGGALGLALQSPQTAAAALAFPFARYGARRLALSKALQKGLLKPSRTLPRGSAGAVAGAMAGMEQE